MKFFVITSGPGFIPCYFGHMDKTLNLGCIDDVQFYIIFNSISVISR